MRGGGQDDCQSNNGFAGDDSTRRNFIFDSAPSTSGILAIEAPPANTSNSDGTKIDESPYQGQSSSLNLRSDGYTGLVNQAMTCYLNSLLQTLFMTPEFRNAVYRWESVSKDDEAKSIPYQLQKLFLLLQTSDKPALETKDLTRSFGWDSSHAWDQHDVQELCRVMFDALEHTWRKTSCAMIINDLYQGTIKDYVKCLECLNENSKDDVFLDLPLAVKRFGSQQAFSTVSEALQYFVHPEVLEGSNQYQCSNCRNKCNAHKGLKITKFPYLLTIQLKRFDFDYTTLHRIKLNDRMTFPDVLNLNPFIDNAGSKTHTRRRQLDDESLETNFMERADYLRPRRSNTESSEDHSVPSVSMRNIDENGSPPQDPAPSPLLADGRTFKKNESDDEGICLDSASTLNGGSNVVSPLEPEANELDPNMINDRLDPALINAFLSEVSLNHHIPGDFVKNLDNKTWYCFNDQVVTRASVEDIRKTYGGTGMHFMYSYSSSTNAYMLMYRKIDPDQNEKFITSDNFPAHLIHMLKRLSSEEDQQRREEEYQKSLVEMTVNYYHPETGSLSKGIIKIPQVATVDDLIEKCIQEFQLASYGVAADRCRLVGFSGEKIEPVYDSSSTNKRTISHCNQQIVYHDLLLEIRPLHLKKFRPYSEDGVTIKISPIFSKGDTPSTSEGGWRIGKPFIFYAQKNDSVFEVKHQLAEFALWNEKNVHLVLYRYNDRLRVLDVMEKRFLEEVGGQLNPVSVYAIVDDASKFSTSEACSMGNDTHCSANILLQSQRLSILSNDGDKIYSDPCEISALRFIERLKHQMAIKLYLPSVVECREHLLGVNGRMATGLDSCDEDGIETEESSEVCEDGAQVVRSNAAFSGFGVGFPNTDLLHDPLPAPPPPPPPYSPKVAVSVKRRSGIVANNPAYEPPLQSMILQQYDTCTPAPSRSPTPEEPKVPPNHDMQSDFQSQTPAWRFGIPTESTEASFSMYASTPSPQVSPVSATVGDDEIPSLGDDEDDQREKVSVTECGGDNDNDDVRESIVEYVPQLKHWTDGELRPVTTPTAKTDDNSQETPEEENVDFFSEISFDLIQPKPENENDQRIFNISCDGRMTMQQLKDKVASFINATPDQFKFIKMYTTMSEYPWNTPDELVRAISSCEGIKVKLGRVLKEDECLVKFYLFDAENFQPNKFLFDMVLDKNVTLSKTKSKVIRQLKRKCDIETEVSRIRFRELCQNKVDFIKSSCPMQERSTIMCNSLELHVQILKEPDPPNDQFILLFIRRWHPSTASYGTLKEIRLPVDCSYRTLFKMISSSSGINFENIEISCLNETGGFPFEYPKLKLLEETRFHKIPSDDTFFVSHTPLCLYHSGNLLYYRDSTEKSKMISDEERKQMQIQDSVRLRKASSFTFRKERALKIYTEISSSVKEDEENYDL